MSKIWRRISCLGLSTLFALLLLPNSGLAHAVPERASPPIDGVLPKAPETVRIWFTEELDSSQLSITVIGPSGDHVDLGDAAVDLYDPERRVAQVSLQSNLGNGVYIVQWHSASAIDQDAVDGSFRFTIDPLATPVSASPTTTAIANLSATPLPPSTNTQTRGNFSGTFLGPLVIIGALALLVVWAGVRQRSRGRD